jgi:hypothetical protein
VHRAHADDLAGGTGHRRHDAAAQKLPHRRPRAQELTGQIDADDGVPLPQGHLVKCRVSLQPGVVDQDIDGAEPFDHMAEHVLDLVLLRHVGFVCISLGARSTDRVDNRLSAILAGHVIDHDIGTGLPQSDRRSLADAQNWRR